MNIFDLFSTKEINGSSKYKWGKVFASTLTNISEELAPLAKQGKFNQVLKTDHIIWHGKADKPEVLFCFVADPSELSQIKKVYSRITKISPVVTFVIVHQKSDRVGTFDIFRMSQQSYLEHHNRVYDKEQR